MGKTYNQLKEAEKARMNSSANDVPKPEKPAEKPAEKLIKQERAGVSRAPMAFFIIGVLIVLIANTALLLVMKNVASDVRYAIDRTNSMEGDVDDITAQVESITASVEALKNKPDFKNDIEGLQISRDELRDRLNALEKQVSELKSPPAPQQ